jgi:hypothetical protein
MKSDNIFRDIAFGIIFLTLGYYCIFHRLNLVNAFIYYYKANRKNKNYVPKEKVVVFLTNTVLPTMGVCYLALGMVLIFRVINYFYF